MTATLHEIPRENTAFAPTNESVAECLRKMAGQIERGEWGEVHTVVSLIEHDGEMTRQTFGKPLDRARVAGLLFMGAQSA